MAVTFTKLPSKQMFFGTARLKPDSGEAQLCRLESGLQSHLSTLCYLPNFSCSSVLNEGCPIGCSSYRTR